MLALQAQPSSNAARRSRQRFTSRCHVADVVQAVLADMQRVCHNSSSSKGRDGSLSISSAGGHEGAMASNINAQVGRSSMVDVINVVDDMPAPRSEVEEYAVKLLTAGSRDALGAASTDPVMGSSHEGNDQSDTAVGSRSSSTTAGTSISTRRSGSSSRSHGLDSALSKPATADARRQGAALEEKRVRNGKLKQALHVTLKAPSYREGLSALYGGDLSPFLVEDLQSLFG